MDDNESLENLLKKSPVPYGTVLRYLSLYSMPPVSLSASVKLFDLHIEELAETITPERRSQLQQVIAQEAEMILMGEEMLPKEEVIHVGRIAVEQLAPANDWEKITYSIVIPSERPEVANYAIEIAHRYGAPAAVTQRLNAYFALFDGRPSDAVNIAAEAEDFDTLKLLRLYIPREQGDVRTLLEEKIWYFAKQGKLPLEEALSLAKRRGVSMPMFAAALSAVAESPFDKAMMASLYNVGDLDQCILELTEELRKQITALRQQLGDNPEHVANQLGAIWQYGQFKSYTRYPEPSRQMDIVLREGYTLRTDALMLSGNFQEALHSAWLCNHPQTEWLVNIQKLANRH